MQEIWCWCAGKNLRRQAHAARHETLAWDTNTPRISMPDVISLGKAKAEIAGSARGLSLTFLGKHPEELSP